MTFRLGGRIIFFYLIINSMDHSLQEQTSIGPSINTLYVPIGKLYPTVEYAGVLINLNVGSAINRAERALDMADTFLDLHRDRQRIDEWTGDDRVIHFLVIKRHQVKRNLESLEADLHSAQTKYRLPDALDNLITSRPKRSMHLDIEFDVTKCLNTIVQGVVSIFSSPKSLDKIQKSVEKIAYNTSRLESKFDNFASTIDEITNWMNEEMDYYKKYSYMITSVNSALTLADQTIMELLNSITPLIQGKLTHNLLDPLRIQELIEHTQQLADKSNLQVVATEPVDILRCSVTTFATNQSWFALLSLPLVQRSETMDAYQFLNLPWFHHNLSVQWQILDGIVATKSGLYPAIDNVFIPQEDLPKVCERFNDNYLCHTHINRYPTCQISLMANVTKDCSLRLANHKLRYSFGPFNFLFFDHPTATFVKCKNNNRTFTSTYHGLVNMDQFSTCSITTDNFTLPPKSSTVYFPSLINKQRKLTILDNEWIKVAVEFDKQNAITTNIQNQQSMPPSWADWNNITVSLEDEDIKIFGSYTILVNSILMFFVVTLLISFFTLCILNFFHYIPERFQPQPIDMEQFQPSEDAKEIASSEG